MSNLSLRVGKAVEGNRGMLRGSVEGKRAPAVADLEDALGAKESAAVALRFRGLAVQLHMLKVLIHRVFLSFLKHIAVLRVRHVLRPFTATVLHLFAQVCLEKGRRYLVVLLVSSLGIASDSPLFLLVFQVDLRLSFLPIPLDPPELLLGPVEAGEVEHGLPQVEAEQAS